MFRYLYFWHHLTGNIFHVDHWNIIYIPINDVLLSHICMFVKLHKDTLHYNWMLLWHHSNSDANKAVVYYTLRSPVSNILHHQPKDFQFTLLLFSLRLNATTSCSPLPCTFTVPVLLSAAVPPTSVLFNKLFWVQFYHPVWVSITDIALLLYSWIELVS